MTGFCMRTAGERFSPLQRFVLAAAGPAVNFALAGVWAVRLAQAATIRGSAFWAASSLPVCRANAAKSFRDNRLPLSGIVLLSLCSAMLSVGVIAFINLKLIRIDGALATRFNVYIAQLLADFRRVAL